jgi:hypothetical protein
VTHLSLGKYASTAGHAEHSCAVISEQTQQVADHRGEGGCSGFCTRSRVVVIRWHGNPVFSSQGYSYTSVDSYNIVESASALETTTNSLHVAPACIPRYPRLAQTLEVMFDRLSSETSMKVGPP